MKGPVERIQDLDKPRVMPMCAAEVCGDIKEEETKEETPLSTEPPISERDLWLSHYNGAA